VPSSKPTLGVNDLQSQYPDIAAEAYGWDPSTITKGSGQKKDWKCKEGHLYFSTVANRTCGGNGCPVCDGMQVLAGFNDLKTKFPDIAAEAFGWDPSTITKGSNKKQDWKCREGHIYSSAVKGRTGKGNGCPVCDGKQVLAGFNDLKTKFPDIAAEAYGWDPTTFTAGSGHKKDWKCKEGHIYTSTVSSRTTNESGCPVCDGKQVLAGFNDLQSLFPDIAAEAYGWDPEIVTKSTGQKKDWKCKEGHIYSSRIADRTSSGSGCPVCDGKHVLAGFNDLKTKFPDIAAEAYGWDSETVTAGSNQKQDWKCTQGHIYSSVVSSRTSSGNGCPVCDGKQVLAGFNDLQSLFPDIAAEAFGWDPKTVTKAIHQKKDWKCNKGHNYSSSVASRTRGSGCPTCAEHGFDPEKDAWFYLMQRPGEQQLGISNVLVDRLRTHESNGWSLIEHTTVPSKGQKVLDTENAFKKWLKKEIGLMEGTTENWSTTKMEVQSLAELKARSGIETDLF
jgi:Zn finger protein HypA/HybF involved in hydrogenase expression